jgi:hypothetical protein
MRKLERKIGVYGENPYRAEYQWQVEEMLTYVRSFTFCPSRVDARDSMTALAENNWKS